MFSDYFLIDFIELYKIRPSKRKLLEQFGALVLRAHKLHLVFFKSLVNSVDGHRPALKRVVFVLLRDWDDYNLLIDPVVEDAPYQFILALVEEDNLLLRLAMDWAPASLKQSDQVAVPDCQDL